MPEPSPAELLARLAALSTAVNRGRLYETAIEATGTTLERPAITILGVLNASDGPRRVGEIAHRMQVEGPHVTRHVKRLEERGLVRSVTDPDDRRARLVELTPDGQQVIDRYLAVIFGWFDSALAGWSPSDRADLHRLATRLFDDLTDALTQYAPHSP
ncbi:MarR family winged helix-turn-helix transcriptional regulator [Actinomadura rupiterrae]|uniref:MarR family winged helix-turn-helix transcriptional regulator n=1 Tax=Actinomadura rupiterrae TaxID=559627 RepID=UPI0020A4C71A|nr:MarR family transcriptional regulator [Actinomadura rupiterrae]MCP2335626.1 DNA-binding MarR family transcriptional regulator [Actinomadura rupiterrae]